ncbi:6-bladed beta-propeller protein [Algoriphagus aquaeductus]|uniref:6-bladed beta-propeller protein n=1 Tax=Algoriphagus aquaeductus TaxID=475299 RepID=A0A326RP72_9BACT|nr:6-bladed beta-propeller protein [Algoriphagus aquaeductus]
MRKLFRLLTFSILLSCSPQNKESTFYLDQEAEYPILLSEVLEKDFWELFKLESAIELKLSQDYFISTIYRLKVHQNEYFALDETLGNLIRFDSNGKPLNRIGKIGEGPEELPNFSDFGIDERGNIVIGSGSGRKASIYSKEGEFLYSIKFKDQLDQLAVGNNHIFASLTYFNQLNKNLAIYNLEGDTLRTYFPYSSDVFPILLKNISGHLTTNFSGSILFNEPASAKIFEINEELEIKPKFQFISDTELWEENDRHNLNGFFETLGAAKLTHLRRFYEESDRYLLFNLNKKQDQVVRYVIDPRIGFFDKKTGKAYLSKKSESLVFTEGPLVADRNNFTLSIPKQELKKLVDNDPNWSGIKNFIEFSTIETEEYDSPILLKFSVRE